MTGFMHEKEFSRKKFLRGGGALLVGFSVAGIGFLPGKAQAVDSPFVSSGPVDPTAFDSWITIHADNTATIKTGRVEVGNGTPTGYLMIAGEELDMDMSQLRFETMDTNKSPNTGSNTADLGVVGVGPIVRGAAAYAKQALLGMASVQLGVPVASLAVKSGVVSGGGKSVTYGSLLGGKLFNLTMPVTPRAMILTTNSPLTTALSPLWQGQSPAKSPDQYKLVGTKVLRFELPAKVMGTYTYLQNVRVPRMLHGRVVQQRGQGILSTPDVVVSVDKSSINHIPDAQVVQSGNFVGVVAAKEYDAIQAAAQLKVTWADRPPLNGSGNQWSTIRANDDPTKPVASSVNTGNVDAALASSAHVVSATYAMPYHGHMPIGPSCSVADVTATGAVIYAGTYGAYTLRANLAKQLGLPANVVRVLFYEGSSSHGGASLDNSDTPAAAALMSQLVGKPVRVQYMRWDEHGYDYYQGPQLIDVRGGVDANGKITAFDTLSNGGGTPSAQGLMGGQYVIPNWRIQAKTSAVFFKSGIVRAVQYLGQGFATLQMFDELAHAANMDPVAFFKLNVTTSSTSRWLDVVDAVTKAANWQPKVSASKLSDATVVTGRGIAIGGKAESSNVANGPGLDAVIADIEVNKKTGKIVVKHVYTAHDYGLIIGPDLVDNSVIGQVNLSVSHVLNEQVQYDKHGVTSLDWVSYPILRFKDHPNITNVAISRPELVSSSSGEELMPPVVAAVANAFFDATGVRMREAPLTRPKVRAALKAAGVA